MGACNCKCFYCIGQEFTSNEEDEKRMSTRPGDLKNFHKFLDILNDKGIETVYLSGAKTDPLMYKHLLEMVRILQARGFKVGIRTNGYLFWDRLDIFELLDEEISFSMQALNGDSTELICGRSDVPDWKMIFSWMRFHHKTCRVSTVVNRFNVFDIPEMLNLCAENSDVVDYFQVRRLFREYEEIPGRDAAAFNVARSAIETACETIGHFGSAPTYSWVFRNRKLPVSVWSKPFTKDAINSVNYFPNGQITTACHLVPGKENHIEEVAN